MRSAAKVSAVIPTYNRTRETLAAIESVLAQTYPNVEVIVVDDGSTDGSGEVIERYVQQKASEGFCIRYFRQKNQGASAARNTGISEAQGEYVGFLDSDDIWLPEKLDWQIEALDRFQNQSAACVTDAQLVNKAGLDRSSFESQGIHYSQSIGIDHQASKSLAESFRFWVSTLVVRTETIREIGNFNPRLSFVEDRDIFFRLSLITSIAYVNRVLIQTDRTPSPPGSICRPWDKKEVQFHQQQLMLESWLQMGTNLSPEIRRVVKQSLGALHSHCTNWHLENFRYGEARHSVARAVRYKPRLSVVGKFLLTWLVPPLASRVAPKTRAIGAGGHAS